MLVTAGRLPNPTLGLIHKNEDPTSVLGKPNMVARYTLTMLKSSSGVADCGLNVSYLEHLIAWTGLNEYNDIDLLFWTSSWAI